MKLWIAFLLVAMVASTAIAEHRAALLIGNGKYPDAPLASPQQDIRQVGDALRKRGFVVTQAENLDAESLKETVDSFAKTVPTCGTALVYFSGYALDGGRDDQADNILFPIDGKPKDTHSVGHSRTGVRWLLGHLAEESGSRANILIVDGCYQHSGQAESSASGLRKSPSLPAESLVIYSAPMGQVETPVEKGPSRLANELSNELLSSRSLEAILREIRPTRESTLEDVSHLKDPASQTVAPADQLRPGTKAGDQWVNPFGFVFCWVPAGSFQMGTPEDIEPRNDDEIVRHVTIDQGFWMSKYELTRQQCEALTGRLTYMASGDHKLQPIDKSRTDDAGRFLTALNATVANGWQYRLPTEEQWEYAARAGTKTPYYFGSDAETLPQHANFADQTLYDDESGIYVYADRRLSDGYLRTAPVGRFAPNPWGLYDIYGNVSEHTSTPYSPSRLDGERPKQYEHDTVIRGGSWLSLPAYCRSAFRNNFSLRTNEGARPNHVGYRFIIQPN